MSMVDEVTISLQSGEWATLSTAHPRILLIQVAGSKYSSKLLEFSSTGCFTQHSSRTMYIVFQSERSNIGLQSFVFTAAPIL